MDHANPSFTANIEGIESEAWLDLFVAAPSAYVTRSVVSHKRFMGAGALAHRTVPITEFNRLIAGGRSDPWTEDEFRAAVDWLQLLASSNWAIQIAPVAELHQVRQWATESGFKSVGNGWVKWYFKPYEAIRCETVSDFEIIAVGKAYGPEFGSVVQQGFGLPESTIPWFSALVGRPNWHTYLAFDKGRAVAAAAMFIQRQWAWMGIDATLDSARRRGAQRSLIAQRLSDGIASGVFGFTAETANPPMENDDGYSSFRNYRRAGFSHTYIRQNYKILHSG